ncbi:flavodoxin family protein [Williamsia muralis]|uniref:Flavodoxin family protein n=1 Tax=Williamsia marianensis TaxID=85044 RepID=A0ABU4EZ68_WILMA|nr:MULTISPECIES: flavodoxin family protein [Williamsia]MDV7135912.1 flavodoxin family protein [Williamsia muralis]
MYPQTPQQEGCLVQTVLVTSSRSEHLNTRRIADAIGEVLGARVLAPEEATPTVLREADRVGFGSGIYWMGFDERLLRCIQELSDMTGCEAFVFGTSGMPEPPFRRYTQRLGSILESRGFEVVDSFTCRGVDTWGPFKLVGGVNKGRPDDNDVQAARRFAETIRRRDRRRL